MKAEEYSSAKRLYRLGGEVNGTKSSNPTTSNELLRVAHVFNRRQTSHLPLPGGNYISRVSAYPPPFKITHASGSMVQGTKQEQRQLMPHTTPTRQTLASLKVGDTVGNLFLFLFLEPYSFILFKVQRESRIQGYVDYGVKPNLCHRWRLPPLCSIL